MPAALLLSLEKQRANLLKKEDTLFNSRAMEILVSPTEIFDLGEDSLCVLVFLIEILSVGRSDVIDFLGLGFLLEVKEAPDAPWGLRCLPSLAVDAYKLLSRLRYFLVELALAHNDDELLLDLARSTH